MTLIFIQKAYEENMTSIRIGAETIVQLKGERKRLRQENTVLKREAKFRVLSLKSNIQKLEKQKNDAVKAKLETDKLLDSLRYQLAVVSIICL